MAVKLGKKPYKHDPRTLRLGALLEAPATVRVPPTFDFDRGRASLPVSSWGNDQWGNCVIAGRANQVVRQQRVETRRTIPLSPVDVIEEYKRLTDSSVPGDSRDEGLVVLYTMRDWRTNGWPIPRSQKVRFTHKIAAYGEVNPRDREQLRAAIFLLLGVHFGVGLPLTAFKQWRSGNAWDIVRGEDPDTSPYSWGGHLVYGKRYDRGGVHVLTWGREVYMTNAFIERYCDEGWVTVDDIDSHARWLDTAKLIQWMREIGAWRIDS
jgi:hypothetical protein